MTVEASHIKKAALAGKGPNASVTEEDYDLASGNGNAAQSPGRDDVAAHILLVDDDQRIRHLLDAYLSDNNCRVTAAENASVADRFMGLFSFDMIILDVMMPGQSGLEFADRIRSRCGTPILMLTALCEPEQRIRGLETGVDDYLPKPFDPRELLLRVRAILRRSGGLSSAEECLCFGPFVFTPGPGALTHGRNKIRLTDREKQILRFFCHNRGQVLQRHNGLFGQGHSETRSVDMQIKRLRQKIEPDPACPIYLETVRGKGYRLICEQAGMRGQPKAPTPPPPARRADAPGALAHGR